jgi:hypothetical protein
MMKLRNCVFTCPVAQTGNPVPSASHTKDAR